MVLPTHFTRLFYRSAKWETMEECELDRVTQNGLISWKIEGEDFIVAPGPEFRLVFFIHSVPLAIAALQLPFHRQSDTKIRWYSYWVVHFHCFTCSSTSIHCFSHKSHPFRWSRGIICKKMLNITAFLRYFIIEHITLIRHAVRSPIFEWPARQGHEEKKPRTRRGPRRGQRESVGKRRGATRKTHSNESDH